MSKKIIFTDKQLRAMRELREVFNLSWEELGRRFGVAHCTARCALEPEYAEYLRQKELARKPQKFRKAADVGIDRTSVPQWVENRRQDYLNAPFRSMADELLGCPPIGFSALDRKMGVGA